MCGRRARRDQGRQAGGLRGAGERRWPQRGGGEAVGTGQCAGLSASPARGVRERAAAGRHRQDRPQEPGGAGAGVSVERAERSRMKAVIIRTHGDLDRLVYDERFPDPHPGPGEVVVAVRATSLNYHDVFTLRGMPGIKIPMPAIMGLDLAGEIAELSPGVEGWKVGDRVLVDPIDRVRGGLMGETIHGGLAERCRAGAHQLIRIPAGVTFADAAALPVAYGTAHRMMATQGRVAAGERVLILGASGGVG